MVYLIKGLSWTWVSKTSHCSSVLGVPAFILTATSREIKSIMCRGNQVSVRCARS
jgi:hypothetical protein